MTSVIPAIDEGWRELAGDLDEVRETNLLIEELMSGGTDMETHEGLDAARKFIVELMGHTKPEIEPQIRSVAGVPVRIFVPGSVDAVYLHIHGGGFAIGVAAMNDVSNSEIAKTCNFAVVSVDYRLAPEHPYPAGPDDCETVARWLIDNSQSEFGTSKLVIGGESAGGNLSAVTLLRVRDKMGAAHRFVGANLVYGVYDMSGAPSSRTAHEKSLVLKRSDMEAFGRLYLGHDDIESRLDPDVSPLYADLSGLPPALFTVGGADPLLDDSLFMAARWQVAGNYAELAFYPECPHGFDMFAMKAGLKARARQMQWMAARVDQAGS
ncbi:MAG: alpha/beta hydrolase [Acidimicrobiales bacterium]